MTSSCSKCVRCWPSRWAPALVFRADGKDMLSALDGTVGMLHLMSHSLAKGAVFGAMSLAAMLPTASFASEWLLFQGLFHEFTLKTDGSRIALAQPCEGKPYFLKELHFDHSQAPLLGPLLFTPTVKAVQWLASRLRRLQNGLMSA